jgi:hypothetical protein
MLGNPPAPPTLHLPTRLPYTSRLTSQVTSQSPTLYLPPHLPSHFPGRLPSTSQPAYPTPPNPPTPYPKSPTLHLPTRLPYTPGGLPTKTAAARRPSTTRALQDNLSAWPRLPLPNRPTLHRTSATALQPLGPDRAHAHTHTHTHTQLLPCKAR